MARVPAGSPSIDENGAQVTATRTASGLSEWRSTARGGSLALIDQGVASGTRFFTTLIIGRVSGPEELGVYALAFLAVLLPIMIQEALITTPYTIYANRFGGVRRAEYTGSVMVHQAAYTLLAMFGLAVFALLVQQGVGPPGLGPVIWVLVAIMPFSLLREFGRRMAFAHLKIGTALSVDLTVAIVQVAGLTWLAWRGALSAQSAYVVMGLACAIAGLAWLVLGQRDFIVRRRPIRNAWRRNWRFGKWVFAGQVVGTAHGYSVHWILALTLGAVATGVFSAAQSIVLLSNPLILGVLSYLEPKSARAFARGGADSVLSVVRRTLLLFGCLMTVFSIVLLVWGDDLMIVLYGRPYGGQRYVIALLAVVMLVSAFSATLGSALRAVERPDVNCKLRVLSLTVTVLTASALVNRWGVLGATVGLLAGTTAGVAVKWIIFVRLVGNPFRQPTQRPAFAVDTSPRVVQE